MGQIAKTVNDPAIEIRVRFDPQVDAALHGVLRPLNSKARARLIYNLIAHGQVTQLAAIDQTTRDAMLSMAALTNSLPVPQGVFINK